MDRSAGTAVRQAVGSRRVETGRLDRVQDIARAKFPLCRRQPEPQTTSAELHHILPAEAGSETEAPLPDQPSPSAGAYCSAALRYVIWTRGHTRGRGREVRLKSRRDI